MKNTKSLSAAFFAPFRPVISEHSGRLFRWIPATYFAAFRPGTVGMMR
jgi:hypothetical protein